MNVAHAELHAALETIAAAERQSDLLRRGYHYAGPHDFALREGRWYEAPTRQHGYPQGAPKMCFGNAINLAVMAGLRYVEGYAMNEMVRMPIHHAWNVNDQDEVIDCTWGIYRPDGEMVLPIGIAYLGVEFSVGRADDATWQGDATVLDDHRRDWPLLREEWRGEPADASWEPSTALRAIRALSVGDYTTAHSLRVRAEEEL